MTERERYRWYAHEGEFEPGAEWEIKMKRRETRVCVRELLMACVRERDDLGLKFSLLSVCVCVSHSKKATGHKAGWFRSRRRLQLG